MAYKDLNQTQKYAFTWYISTNDINPLGVSWDKTSKIFTFTTDIADEKVSGHIEDIVPLYKTHMGELGRIGGARKVPKGFSITGLASEAGRLGGTASRRGPDRKLRVRRLDIKE